MRIIFAILMTLDQALFGLSENDIFICIVARGRRPFATIVDPPHLAKSPLKSSSRSVLTIFMRLDILYIAMKLMMALSPVLVSTSLGKITHVTQY